MGEPLTSVTLDDTVPQLSHNRLNDPIEILIDLAVPKPQNLKPASGEMIIALTIGCRLRIHAMLSAVDFNNDAFP